MNRQRLVTTIIVTLILNSIAIIALSAASVIAHYRVTELSIKQTSNIDVTNRMHADVLRLAQELRGELINP